MTEQEQQLKNFICERLSIRASRDSELNRIKIELVYRDPTIYVPPLAGSESPTLGEEVINETTVWVGTERDNDD